MLVRWLVCRLVMLWPFWRFPGSLWITASAQPHATNTVMCTVLFILAWLLLELMEKIRVESQFGGPDIGHLCPWRLNCNWNWFSLFVYKIQELEKRTWVIEGLILYRVSKFYIFHSIWAHANDDARDGVITIKKRYNSAWQIKFKPLANLIHSDECYDSRS